MLKQISIALALIVGLVLSTGGLVSVSWAASASVDKEVDAGDCPCKHKGSGCPHEKKKPKGCDCPKADCDCPAHKPAAQAPSSFAKPPEVGTQALCPVMNETFSVKKASPRSEYEGKHYVFCCAPCKKKFDANPKKYVGK